MLALLAARGIHDRAVMAAMTQVPRKKFVPDDQMADVSAAPQTISQPYLDRKSVV
jgi:protein-L-isoaspartate O-methyltransferase